MMAAPGIKFRNLAHSSLKTLHLPTVAAVYERVNESTAAEPLRDPIRVHGAELIYGDKSRPILKAAPDTPGIRLVTSCHRRDDQGTEMLIQIIRRRGQGRGAFSESRSRELDPSESGRHHRDEVAGLPPFPFLTIESSGRRQLQKAIFLSPAHLPGGFGPTSTGASC